MLQKLRHVCILVLYSHGVDQEEEAVSLQSSFLVVVELSRFEQLTQDNVDCVHLGVTVKCIVDVGDVLGSDVLLVGEEDLDLKIAVLIVEHQFDEGELVGE